MDNYIESETIEEANVDITPNIKYQINKFGCNDNNAGSGVNIFANKIQPKN